MRLAVPGETRRWHQLPAVRTCLYTGTSNKSADIMASSFLAAVAMRRAEVLVSSIELDTNTTATMKHPTLSTLDEATLLTCIRAGTCVNHVEPAGGGASHLWLASQDGDLSAVALLVHAGAALNQSKAGGITPLYIAASKGHAAVASLLLSARAIPSLARELNGVSPLHIASRRGHTEIVTMLLQAHAATEQVADDGSTPLYAACERSQAGAIAALIAARAIVDCVSFSGASPLLNACMTGDRSTAGLLLSAKATPDAASVHVVTPLYAACQRGDAAIAAMLCAAGATATPPLSRGDLEQRTADQLSGACMAPLSVAVQEGHLETVEALLAARADVHRPSAAHTATPLAIACDHGHARIASMLIAAGAGVDTKDAHGETALFHATNGPYGSILLPPLGLLCPATPLLACSALPHRSWLLCPATPPLACLALPHRPSLALPCHTATRQRSARNHVGIAPSRHRPHPPALRRYRGHASTVAKLLELRATVDAANAAGATPMYAACSEGQLWCAQLLSSYGATRAAIVNGVREEAASVARQAGHANLAAWLEASHHWCTPLHHLSVISAARARELLRGGASLHADDGVTRADGSRDTPLAVAARMHAEGVDAEGTAASMVLLAAQRWSPATHHLYPEVARVRAVEIMLICHRLSRKSAQGAVDGQGTGSLFDALLDRVMAELVVRE